MKQPGGILPHRVRSEAAKYLRRPLVGLATVLAVVPFLMAISDQFGRRSVSLPSTVAWAMVTMVDGMVLTMVPLMVLWEKKGQYPNPVDRGFLRWLAEISGNFVAVRVAEVALRPEGSELVGMEGRMTCAPDGAALTAPISGTSCLYYRVVVEQWTDLPFPQDPWAMCGQRWLREAFTLTDASGFVLVEAPDEKGSSNDDVEAYVSISSRTTVVEARSGINRLPPHVQAYIEASPPHFRSVDSGKRTRVTELTLVDGDVVSVMGHVEARATSAGGFRSEQILVIPSAAPKRIFAAKLDELRWLGEFHRRLTLALLVLAALGLVILGVGILTLTQMNARGVR